MVLMFRFDVYHGILVAGCYAMITIIIDKILVIGILLFLCGIVLLVAPDSAVREEKRSTEQRRQAPLEHAQQLLISNDTTLRTTVSGAHTRTHAYMHMRRNMLARTHHDMHN